MDPNFFKSMIFEVLVETPLPAFTGLVTALNLKKRQKKKIIGRMKQMVRVLE